MGSRYGGTEEELRALNCYIALLRASGSVSSRIHREIEHTGVTERQLAVLEALYHYPEITQKVLAQKLLCTPGNLTALLDKLVAVDLVERLENLEDKRSYHLTLSSKGKKLIRQIFPGHVRNIVEEFKVLSKREQEELRILCRKLGLAGRKTDGETDRKGGGKRRREK